MTLSLCLLLWLRCRDVFVSLSFIGLDNAKALSHNGTIMNKLTHEKRVLVANCLIECCSIRAAVRMTGVAKKTVMRFLIEIGEVCADYQGPRTAQSSVQPHTA